MANKDPKNVKRFVENISKEVANAAYNGGGSSTDMEGLYPNTILKPLINKLLSSRDIEDGYSYIKLSKLKELIDTKFDWEKLDTDEFYIYINSGYIVEGSAPGMKMSKDYIHFAAYTGKGGEVSLNIDVHSYNESLQDEEYIYEDDFIPSTMPASFEDLINIVISEYNDPKVELSNNEGIIIYNFAIAAYEPFLTQLVFSQYDYLGNSSWRDHFNDALVRLDLKKFIDYIEIGQKSVTPEEGGEEGPIIKPNLPEGELTE